MRKGDGFRALSAKALEDYATVALNADAILAEAAKVAALGECLHVVAFERPVDLPRTSAAAELKKALTENGFTLEWVKRSTPMSGIEKTTWLLVIRW